jgi:hypothetical protein
MKVQLAVSAQDSVVIDKDKKYDPKLEVYTVELEKGWDKGYTVTCLELPGCISEGDTKQQAIDNIIEAIQLYLYPTPL